MTNQYKDSLFRSLFTNEKALLDLYNALHNTQYDGGTAIVINTLSETLWTGQKNDISFLIDQKLVIMVEHQATINENMPFRFLQPIGRIFEQGIPDKPAVYRKRRISLPRPEFIVLYNGREPLAERSWLRLSDAFERAAGFEECRLELVVEVYNINRGYNDRLGEGCEPLKGYVYFVDRMRHHEGEARRVGTPAERVTLTALRKAIADCKAAGLLSAFWANLTREDERMLCTEWDWNLAVAVSREEGIEEGIKKGIEKGREEGIEKGREEGIALGQNRILNLLSKGYTVEDIRRELTRQQETGGG